MEVVFNRRHRSWQPFDEHGVPRIYNLADGQANVFIRRGICKAYVPPKPKPKATPKRKKQDAQPS